MCDDLRFRHPFSLLVSGPSGSGKTSFCIQLLQNLDFLCTESDFEGGIIWCYSERNAVPSRKQLPANVTFNVGVPE
jgi:GTPase SAR1 family protein